MTNPPWLEQLCRQFLAGKLSPDETRQAVRRLIKAAALGTGGDPSPTPVTANYDAVLDKAATTFEAMQREMATAEEMVESLLTLPPERQRIVVRNSAKHQTWAMTVALQQASLRACSRDPREAVALAELSVEIASRLVAEKARPRIHDLHTAAWVQLANARRLASDFSGAHEALEEAAKCLPLGSGDPTEEGRLLAIEGALLSDESRFEPALVSTKTAITLFRQGGDRHEAGKAMLQEASLHQYLGVPEKAISTLKRALAMLDTEREPRLGFVAATNLGSYLVDLGRPEEASTQLTAAQTLAKQTANPLDLLRIEWLRGRLALSMSQWASAELRLREVRDAFLRRDLPHETALVSLELAIAVSERQRYDEAVFICEQIAPLFRAMGVEPEAIASLQLAANARLAQTVRVEILRQLVVRLRGSTARGQGAPDPRG